MFRFLKKASGPTFNDFKRNFAAEEAMKHSFVVVDDVFTHDLPDDWVLLIDIEKSVSVESSTISEHASC